MKYRVLSIVFPQAIIKFIPPEHETGCFTHASHSWKYKKNPVTLVKQIPYLTSKYWISSNYQMDKNGYFTAENVMNYSFSIFVRQSRFDGCVVLLLLF